MVRNLISLKPIIFIIAHIFFIVKEIKRNKMKICAIICEYNPFHNGHSYQISEAKRLSGCDAVLCIMSGNFVQRGEAAIMDKYTRAKHAVLSGADAVVELPSAFATSNAELFAKGAVHILSSTPEVTTLCFGAETADKQAFLQAATLLNDEPQEVSAEIKRLTAMGVSFAKARAQAWQGLLDTVLLSSPNNILGLEYTRALLAKSSNIEILPIQRKGNGYLDTTLTENFSSASAIRAAITAQQSVDGNLPDFVQADLPNALENKLDTLEKYAILANTPEQIAKTCDCTEGLENAFKKAALKAETLETSLTNARYTSARIRRIALQNLLKIQETSIRAYLSNPLYLRVLAIKQTRNDVLSSLSKSSFPLIVRAHDENALNETAKKCYETDIFADNVHGLLYKNAPNKNIFL